MNTGSVFVDVDCGGGMYVVQVRFRADVRNSIGIEFLTMRYLMGLQLLIKHPRSLSLRLCLLGWMGQSSCCTVMPPTSCSQSGAT